MTTVSLSAASAQHVRQAEINRAELLLGATEAKLPNADCQQWLDENRNAIENYNKHVVQHGVFSDGLRRF